MTFLQDETEDPNAYKREKLSIALFLSVVTVFIFFDILDDWLEGNSSYHIVFEILLGVLGVGFAARLFLEYNRTRSTLIKKARDEVVEAKRMASDWQRKAMSFKDGLTKAITSQLQDWGLTDSEMEICFLLLKGFSLQEIADLRSTSERTVRQQASVIYKKSALSGRVQLAAFFLEDFLVGNTSR